MHNHENHKNHEPMKRVNRETPCPVCGKHDWCLVSADKSAAICARVEKGSKKRSGDAGWLHIFDKKCVSHQRPVTRYQQKKKNGPSATVGMAIDFAKLSEQFSSRCSERQVRFLGQSLGVTANSLKRLNVGWDGEAFCFPMADERSHIIGIRRRFGNGKKFCITGSKNGLFIPAGIERAERVVICEGPTDCAAALDLGWSAIGRPNCDSKVAMTVAYVRQRAVVIIADRDSAGMRGARKLYEALMSSGSSVRIILPPDQYKDLREWKRNVLRITL